MNDRRPAARPGRIRGGPATRRKHQAIIEPQAVNDRLLEVCAHYAAAPGATAGRRTTWACPRCAKAKFEALPERGLAGCWNAACEVPQTTNALGLIAFFAGLDRRTDFPQILTVAAEILGEGSAATPHANRSPRGGRRPPGPSRAARPPGPDPDLLDAAYTGLLAMCPISDRDRVFWSSRGLTPGTVRQARLASATRPRILAALGRLAAEIGEEALLSVPGFFENGSGRLSFTLLGDYQLVPYLDRTGRITTIEGRATEAQRKRLEQSGIKAKYVSLRRSGSHLYLFPGLSFDDIQAFTEGSVGAMVAAQEGLCVAAIKGVRCYRNPDGGPLPELAGADLSGRTVPFIPDADDPPNSDVLDSAPKAALVLTRPHSGRPAIAYLPRGLDLDEWLLSLPKDRLQRRRAFAALLARAGPQT